MEKRENLINIIYTSKNEKEALSAWETLKTMDAEEDNDVIFWLIIAAKINFGIAHEKVIEKAWNDMLERGIKKPEITLYYLSINAPDPQREMARELLNKYIK
jgi:hypothetical protein